jgi:hypothetical protein
MAIEDLRVIGNVLYERRSDGLLYPVRQVAGQTPAQSQPQAPQGLLSGIPELGRMVDTLGNLNQMFNPVESVGQSMAASQRMAAPNVSGWDRVAALGDMLSGVAGVAAPAAVASRAGTPAAVALMEGLLGGSPAVTAARDAARAAGRGFVERMNQLGPVPTMGSNFANLLGDTLPAPRNEAEAIAKNILELRATGNVDAVTNDMMNAADPQYMYNYTPLPMDEASRMARAKVGGFSDALHGTGADIAAVDPSYFGSGGADLLGSGFYTTTKPSRAENYATKGRSSGGRVMPLMVREPRPFDLGEPLGNAADEIANVYKNDPSFTVSEMSSGVKFIEDINGNRVMLDPYLQRHWALQILSKAFGAEDVYNVLSEAGYSGVSGSEALGGKVRVAYNPSDVRSRFARFDPMFAHLGNLSAGVAISPLAYGLLSNQYERKNRQ